MQKFDIYLRATSTKAALVDAYNNSGAGKAALVFGMGAELVLHLFKSEGEEDLYAAADLSDYVSWVFYSDSDYDSRTTPKLRVDDGIYIDNDGAVHIPIDNTATAEMAAYLGTAESKDLRNELVGMAAGSTIPDFCVQWDMSIRNRVGVEGGGQPEPVADSNYTAAQVDAIIAAANEVQYSEDGDAWSSTYTSGCIYRRYRNGAVSGAAWTIENLAAGPQGATYFPYIGYAADSDGTDFSVTPSNGLKWRGEFHSTRYIPADDLAYSDFVSAGAAFVKFLGDDGNGDMSTSDYVAAGGTGVVLSAGHANKVPWGGVENPPAKYPPSSHSHSAADIADGARQTVFASSGAAELYLDRQVIVNEVVVSDGIITLDFSAVRPSSGGTAYAAAPGDVFTWEYWCKASVSVSAIAVGSSLSIKVLEGHDLPDDLPARGSVTIHAFAVRGHYKSGASQNLQLAVNYLYSTEA